MTWFSDAVSTYGKDSLYDKNRVVAPDGVAPSTFTRVSYVPGALNVSSVDNQQQTVEWWQQQLASKARGRTPYIYPVPPPVSNPVTFDEDDPAFWPKWMRQDSKVATVMDGIAHDSFQNMAAVGGWEDPIYSKVYLDSEGNNAKQAFDDLSTYEKLVWKAAAKALGGGSRSAQSTFAAYLQASANANADGTNKTAWDALVLDAKAGLINPEIFKGTGEISDDDSSSGWRSYGGGGYGGGGGGGNTQIDLMNENDARAVVNSLASQMLGRTVGEKEFQQYYKTLLQLQKDNPQVVEFGDDGSMTVNQGITNTGLQYMLEEEMRGTDDFEVNSVATQAMDLLQEYVNSRTVR